VHDETTAEPGPRSRRERRPEPPPAPKEGASGGTLGSSATFGRVEREELQLGRIERVDEEGTPLEDEDLWTGEDEADHLGWYCVATDPFPCPAEGCGFIAVFMTAAHLVLVWQEQDDPNLLRHAQRAKEVGRNPRVVTYESIFGPSASYYAWEAAGRPVHGVRRS